MNCCSKERRELKFEVTKSLSAEEFRRLMGVKKATFEKMVEILKVADSQKKKRGGVRTS
jgi:hypothetical protein